MTTVPLVALVPTFDALTLVDSCSSPAPHVAHTPFNDTHIDRTDHTNIDLNRSPMTVSPVHLLSRRAHSPAPSSRSDKSSDDSTSVAAAARQAEAVKLAASYASKITQNAQLPSSISPYCNPTFDSPHQHLYPALCISESSSQGTSSPDLPPLHTPVTDETNPIRDYIDSTKKLRSEQRLSPLVQINAAQKQQYKAAFNVAAALADEINVRLVDLYSQTQPTLLLILQLVDVICKVQEQADYFAAGISKYVFTLSELDAVISFLFSTLYQLTRDDTAFTIVRQSH
jgi:hypothetical protein